ncbi:hypothetical protein [Pseudomonas fulva]|uniref:hypothetical protein n=1 Tax=Pseudomonas fulva TaxID=47880 RepID=UPI003461FFF3
MSIGIKSKNSQFTVGKANIVADVGADLDESIAHFDEFNHVATNAKQINKIFKGFKVKPSAELVAQAIDKIREEKSTDGLSQTPLKEWFDNQGLNAALWVNVVAQLGAAVLGS